ncbi:MAG: hypothetical protein GC152_07390 [Alphaproteobacteria bacterium]|nr:hypothetical protein [Alphaproteobacteria bacterium]
MEVAPAVEQRRERATPLRRLRAALGDFLVGFARMTGLTLILLPILIFSFLTVDIPVRAIDHWFALDAAKPGGWLSRGDIIMCFVGMAAILIARRFGGDEAARAITAAWGVAAVSAFAGVAWLAPQLEPGDMPTFRYVAAFVGAALAGQYVAVGLYDVLRGGVKWWRAPLYSLLTGYGLQSAIFFGVVYWGTARPWMNWLATDIAIKSALAVGFLGVYAWMRRKLRPRGGLGG